MSKYFDEQHEYRMEEIARHRRNAELRDEEERLKKECGVKHKLGSHNRCNLCYKERHKNDPPPTVASDDFR